MSLFVELHPGNAPVYVEADEMGTCTTLKLWTGHESRMMADNCITLFIRRSQCPHEAVQAIADAFKAAYATKQETDQ